MNGASCLQQNPLFCPERCSAFQCDLTQDDLRSNVPEGGVDVVTLIFVLSAVHPDKMKQALQNISRVRAQQRHIIHNTIITQIDTLVFIAVLTNMWP